MNFILVGTIQGQGLFCLAELARVVWDLPYSRKYWLSLNLAVWFRAAEIKILADLNLAVVPYT